jgi:Bacterial Ig domain
LQVGSSDTDPNPSNVCCTAALAAAPGHGSAVVNADGSFTYTPSTGFAGKDSLTYTLTDSDGNVSAPATVNVTVLYKCNPNGWGSFSGRPPVDSQDPQGFYVGQRSGTFSLFTAHPGTSDVVFTGTLTLNPAVNGVRFSNVTVLKGEDNSSDQDTVTLIGERTLKFHFDTYRSVDGVQFHPSCASSMTFDLQINGVEASPGEIYLGAHELHVKAIPFTMTR